MNKKGSEQSEYYCISYKEKEKRKGKKIKIKILKSRPERIVRENVFPLCKLRATIKQRKLKNVLP